MQHTCQKPHHDEQLTIRLEKLTELYEAQVELCTNTKQQMELANQKVADYRSQIEQLNIELVEKTTLLEDHARSTKVQRQGEVKKLIEQVTELTSVRKTYELEFQRLQAEIVTLQADKAIAESRTTALEVSLQDKKSEKKQLKTFRKELALQNKQFELVIQERDAELQELRIRNDEVLTVQAEDKQVIADQTTQISELKVKL